MLRCSEEAVSNYTREIKPSQGEAHRLNFEGTLSLPLYRCYCSFCRSNCFFVVVDPFTSTTSVACVAARAIGFA
jgi:hypothetical protein